MGRPWCAQNVWQPPQSIPEISWPACLQEWSLAASQKRSIFRKASDWLISNDTWCRQTPKQLRRLVEGGPPDCAAIRKVLWRRQLARPSLRCINKTDNAVPNDRWRCAHEEMHALGDTTTSYSTAPSLPPIFSSGALSLALF